ncbi:uncharacterized protein BBA_09102 [Beauveria bassiana ARSEF 2860]|uniref:Uncharacterized protein n=1 Tax=Beauveria bassiana (strain ARSEF 2860) TaxID=655819 RepID=J5JDW1_BEAB2|nr:uncharacterized protein BBA_09102 [Beauveria bassiana ARSEF 2860]EJP61946.1 hypothetical protein BBA_09102 [Beauveria bassiana ARSEF 2860]
MESRTTHQVEEFWHRAYAVAVRNFDRVGLTTAQQVRLEFTTATTITQPDAPNFSCHYDGAPKFPTYMLAEHARQTIYLVRNPGLSSPTS